MLAKQDGPHTIMVCRDFEVAQGDKHPVLVASPEVLLIHREGRGRPLAALAELMPSADAC